MGPPVGLPPAGVPPHGVAGVVRQEADAAALPLDERFFSDLLRPAAASWGMVSSDDRKAAASNSDCASGRMGPSTTGTPSLKMPPFSFAMLRMSGPRNC